MNKTHQIINLNLTELLNDSTFNTEKQSPTSALSALLYNNSTSLYDNMRPQMGGNNRINNEHNLNVYSATSSYNIEQQYMSSSLNALLYNTNQQSGGSFDNSFKQAQLSKQLQTIKLDLSSLESITETPIDNSELLSPFNALLYNTNYYEKYDNNAPLKRQDLLKRDPLYNEFYTKAGDAKRAKDCLAAPFCWEEMPKKGQFKLPRDKGFVKLHDILYQIMLLLAEFRKLIKSILLRLIANNSKIETFVTKTIGDVQLLKTQPQHYADVQELGIKMVHIKDFIKDMQDKYNYDYNSIISDILHYTDYLVIPDPNAKQELTQEQELEQELQSKKSGIFKQIKNKISSILNEKTIPVPLKITYDTLLTAKQINPFIQGIKKMRPNVYQLEHFLQCLQTYVPKIREVINLAHNKWPKYVAMDNKIIKNRDYLTDHYGYLEKIMGILTDLQKCQQNAPRT